MQENITDKNEADEVVRKWIKIKARFQDKTLLW